VLGGYVAGLADGGGQAVDGDGSRIVGHSRDLGGEVHLGQLDTVDAAQRLLDAAHARRAGHAPDVEGDVLQGL
jgi:hypothetical protein